MNFQKFLIGLLVAFGLPWVLAIAIPYSRMANLPPVELQEEVDGESGYYEFTRPGRTDGASVYAGNGCTLCHTQLIRPTTAGTELWRDDWAGHPGDPANEIEDSRRETNPYDYAGEDFAYIGQTRIGPDLSNVALRAREEGEKAGMAADQWLLKHLYDPRSIDYLSVCPPSRFMFEGSVEKPKSEAKALAAYLLSMKKDTPIPAALNPREPSPK
jgi:cbb3-type cytochrome oxidase cytochrome c subunit